MTQTSAAMKRDPLRPGDMVRIRRVGGDWFCAEVLLVTKNGTPGAVGIDHGVGFPMAIIPEIGCVVLLLTEHGGTFTDLFSDCIWEVDYNCTGCGQPLGFAEKFARVFKTGQGV